ncbi:Beta-Amyrin Synthase 2 [Vitis vinifera]|uniref:Beta-Amyrin Synthase 2 n=1 Tax=Vitis vinifera TaxID=29760 RepID=A0A438FSA5_VITVI|nr:Beta-Amyrin Synthase 2 [Vitis vinifera]
MWRLKVADGGNDPYIYSTNNFVGRQIWEFDPDYGTPEERAEVGDGEEITYETATAAVRRGAHFFSALQASDGHWPAENAGPLYFLPPLVMCLYITGHLDTVFPGECRKEILRYLYCHQNEDGGWGLHIEGHSTMFCTTLSYICMRILGEGRDGGRDNACARGRKWILDRGGVTSIPSWGKTWLSIFGLFDWSGSNPMPPEFGSSLLVFLCIQEDLYYPHPLIQDLMWDSLYICTEPLLTRWPLNKLRQKALEVTMKHIHYEDENSRYITLASVEKALCMLACWVEDPNGDYFKKHLVLGFVEPSFV